MDTNNTTFLPDIYDITDVVNNLQKKYNEDLSDETLSMSMYGWNTELFANSLQNSIVMAAEWGNEAFPIRSKFEKNILTNAVTYNVDDINAIPAQMDVMIGFVEKELEAQLVNDKFTLYSDCKFNIGGFEFHLDYDIIITKALSPQNEYVYAARYDIGRLNALSDIKNPYLQPPIKLTMHNSKWIFITCTIRQVQYEQRYSKIITNNILDHKTFDFEFEDQLAAFDVVVTEGNKTTYLTPIFEGMPLEGEQLYCFYTFLNANTIRIKFDRNSYEPKLNCNMTIDLKTTKGSGGNFNYNLKREIINSLESEKTNYRNLSVLIQPITVSRYGIDRKSIEDLKQIIPKEILSRGNITNNKDLENFFNTLDGNRLMFYRRRDNQRERLFYAYLLVKDMYDNIIPTNTLNMVIKETEFNENKNQRYIINPGNKIKLIDKNTAIIDNTIPTENIYNEEQKGFIYSTPFICVVNKHPLSVSYYMNNINKDFYFKFGFINTNSSLQFISTSLNCSRNYIDTNNYKISLKATQNMNLDRDIVQLDQFGNIISCNIKPVLVIRTEKYNYYVYGKVVSVDQDLYQYNIEFELETDNIINQDNQIKINNVYIGGSSSIEKEYIYLNDSVDISVYMTVKFPDGVYGRDDLDSIIPTGMEEYTVCNRYDTIGKMDLFYNYSHIMKSTVKVIGRTEEEKEYIFQIKGVPMVRYSYLSDVERCMSIIDYLQYRKVYIDSALEVLEDSFTVDLKFFNTYGPSKMFEIGHNDDILDKVNLSLTFKTKLKVGADKKTVDKLTASIKEYVENINDIRSIHISNLITELTNTYKADIEFIEFLGANNYNALYQYIKKVETEILDDVPEFVNINLKEDLKPDINIILA